ncbi:glycosyltransferase family 4 protein [bacterium]|nr:glycosyltransferase family 4 protein [bacterium]
MRVIQACRSRSWGGMEMVAVNTALRLRARGVSSVLLAFPGTPVEKTARANGLELLSMEWGGYLDAGGIRRFRMEAGRLSPDVVHVHQAKDLWMIAPALRRLKTVPLILTRHVGTQKPKRDWLHAGLYRRVDRIIAISGVIRKNVADTHPIAQERILTIPNGVDLAAFDPARVSGAAVRRKFGIPLGAPVIGTAGRMNWWKGYREFLMCAEEVLRRDSRVWFLAAGGATVGEEEEARAIRDFAGSLNLRGRLVFAGFCEDMPEIYAAMDMLVYPAYAEAFGIVLIEAMAMGLPVIASDCDGIPEIVKNGETGILVPAREAGPLAQAVLDLLNNAEKRQAFGRRGRARAERCYDWERILDDTMNLYRTVIQERSLH